MFVSVVGHDFKQGFGRDFCFFTRKKKQCGPVASETILVWVLSGPLSSEHSFSSCLTTHSMRHTVERPLEENEDLKQKLSRFWEIENGSPFDEYGRDVKREIQQKLELHLTLPGLRMDLPSMSVYVSVQIN